MKSRMFFFLVILLSVFSACDTSKVNSPEQKDQPKTLLPAFFTSSPPGAVVTVYKLHDGGVVGSCITPDTLRLSEGYYQYTLGKEGYLASDGAGLTVASNQRNDAPLVSLTTIQPTFPPATGEINGPDTVTVGLPASYTVTFQNVAMAFQIGGGFVTNGSSFQMTFNVADAQHRANVEVVVYGKNSQWSSIKKQVYVKNAPIIGSPIASFTCLDVTAPDSTFVITTQSSNGTWALLNGMFAPLNGQITYKLSSTSSLHYLVFALNGGLPAEFNKIITVRNMPLPAKPSGTLAVDSLRIVRGSSVIFTSVATGADYGILAPLGSYIPLGNGTVTFTPTITQSYKMSYGGRGGTDTSRSVTVVVAEPVGPTVTFSFSIQPDTIFLGQSSTTFWSTTGADELIISGYTGFGAMTLNGSQGITPTQIGTITLRGEAKVAGVVKVIKTVKLVVLNTPPTIVTGSIRTNPDTIVLGQNTNVIWASQNADRIMIDAFGEVGSTGSRPDQPSSVGVKWYRAEFWKSGVVVKRDSAKVFVLPASLQLGLPSPISPAFGATGLGYVLSFLWDAGVNTTSTDFELLRQNGSRVYYRQAIASSIFALPDTLLSNTQYQWRLRGRRGSDTTSWTSPWPFTTIAVQALNPIAGHTAPDSVASNTTFNITLRSTYGVTADLSNFGPVPLNGTVQTSILNNTMYVHRVVGLPGTVAALDTFWVYVRSVVVTNDTLRPFTIVAPPNGATGTSVFPLFKWTSAGSVGVFYDVEFYNSLGNFLWSVTNRTDTTYNRWVAPFLDSLQHDQTYTILVKARKGTAYLQAQSTFRTAPVVVLPLNPRTAHTAPDTVNSNDLFTISFRDTNGVSGRLSPGFPTRPLNGSIQTRITNSTQFVNTLDGQTGTIPATETFWVYVRSVRPPALVHLTLTADTVCVGTSTPINVVSTNADYVTIDVFNSSNVSIAHWRVANGTNTVSHMVNSAGEFHVTAIAWRDSLSSNEETKRLYTKNCTPVVNCAPFVGLTVDKQFARAGDTLVYRHQGVNNGTGNCTGGGYKIEHDILSYVQYLSQTHSSNVSEGYGSDPLFNGSVLRHNVQVLHPGETYWVEYKVKVMIPGNYSISTTARVSAAELNWNWVYSNQVVVNITNTPPQPTRDSTCISTMLDYVASHVQNSRPIIGSNGISTWQLNNVAGPVTFKGHFRYSGNSADQQAEVIAIKYVTSGGLIGYFTLTPQACPVVPDDPSRGNEQFYTIYVGSADLPANVSLSLWAEHGSLLQCSGVYPPSSLPQGNSVWWDQFCLIYNR